MKTKHQNAVVDGLSAAQSAAVTSTSNLRLVVAGPGSGKTRTLAAAVAAEAQRVGASKCLVVTFTNAAAAELERRLASLGVRDVGYVGPLHSFLLRLLGEHGRLAGLPATLSVLDDDAKTEVVQTIIEDLGSRSPASKVEKLLKSTLGRLGSGQLRNWTKGELVALEYHQRLRESGLLDFDSILHYGLNLIHHFARERETQGEAAWWPYSALFVDEYQDSGDDDAAIYAAMPCERKLYVGDTDQAIYSFRGGNVRNMAALAEGGGGEVFLLEDNYRSVPEVCGAAQRLVLHNKARIDKVTRARRGHDRGSVVERKCADPLEEQAVVADNLAMQRKAGVPWGEMAVLARTNRIAQGHAEFLKGRGVPLAQRKHQDHPADWRETKLLLAVMANPWNDFAAYQYLRAVNGKEQADVWRTEAAKAMRSLNDHKLKMGVAKMDSVYSMLDKDVSPASRERVHDACRRLSGRGEWSLQDLLCYLNAFEEAGEVDGDGVFVGTMHGAKGREFKFVAVVGAEQGTTPSGRKDVDLEEERRLFYVAVTRAKDELLVTWCAGRPPSWGVSNRLEPRERSQFVGELLGEAAS